MVVPAISFAWSNRAHGDFSGDGGFPSWPGAPEPWTTLRQVHGGDVVVVERPGELDGAEADAAVTAVPGCTLVVRTADCVPLVLAGDRAVGVVHVGWRGLLAGVVERAAAALRELGGGGVAVAHLGPCIRAGCYEFAGPERDDLADRFGPGVRATTVWGSPALDLAGAARAACRAAGITDIVDEAGCTACDLRWFSHRARGEEQRFATLAWIAGSTP